MDYIRSVEIELEKKVYFPGDKIRGNVIINASNTLYIKAIKIILRGKIHLAWQIKKKKDNRKICEERYLIDRKIYINQNKNKKNLGRRGSIYKHAFVIEQGKNAYHFTIVLPFIELPYSYESEYAWIRYYIRASLECNYGTPAQYLKYLTLIGPKCEKIPPTLKLNFSDLEADEIKNKNIPKSVEDEAQEINSNSSLSDEEKDKKTKKKSEKNKITTDINENNIEEMSSDSDVSSDFEDMDKVTSFAFLKRSERENIDMDVDDQIDTANGKENRKRKFKEGENDKPTLNSKEPKVDKKSINEKEDKLKNLDYDSSKLDVDEVSKVLRVLPATPKDLIQYFKNCKLNNSDLMQKLGVIIRIIKPSKKRVNGVLHLYIK
ncbi:hypothetical protein A3Q56_04698 [Intoshia linei]|uniref:Arrestin-like N-terminal domain-containing protein n=1 Tax=Intoshia linei TaxID=1819745 RepID=A0A177B2B2_9BILA|nr:hypothetical protein A3Q56_04698 [Intoshia linei]